jgi:DNA replication and repair protein RecF
LYLSQIECQNFRSYNFVEHAFDKGVVGVFGSNGLGKTNLLEAVHFILQGHSHRTRKNKELIKWESSDMILRGEGSLEDRKHTMALQIYKAGKNRVKVNGSESSMLSDLLGHFAVVSLGPDDIALVQGAPANRRRFLDALLSQYSSEYLHNLRHYNRFLKQRNHLLKAKNNTGGVFDSISYELVNYGVKIMEERYKWVLKLNESTQKLYHIIAGGKESLEVFYKTTLELSDNLIATFHDKLNSRKERELLLGSTQYGPHKDDLDFILKGHSLRDFGSQGQHRSASLALKLGAAKQLQAVFQKPPIYLLDDVFAELDLRRRSALGELIQGGSQTFIASPHPEDIPFPLDQTINLVSS